MEKLYFYEEHAFFSKAEVSLLGRILDFLRKSFIFPWNVLRFLQKHFEFPRNTRLFKQNICILKEVGFFLRNINFFSTEEVSLVGHRTNIIRGNQYIGSICEPSYTSWEAHRPLNLHTNVDGVKVENIDPRGHQTRCCRAFNLVI